MARKSSLPALLQEGSGPAPDLDGFYPTPLSLLEKILRPHVAKIHKSDAILEPSAGRGDIVRELARRILRDRRHMVKDATAEEIADSKAGIDAIEINPELQHVLKGEGFRVVHDDFLTYRTFKRYNWIFMNPPFAAGDKHLRKALDLLAPKGTVVCILNAETIRNPFSNTRKELARILGEWNAEITFERDAFTSADRRTGVEIAIVRATAPEERAEDWGSSFIFEGMKKEEAERIPEADEPQNEVVENDFVKTIVRRYQLEVEAGLRLVQEWRSLLPRIDPGFRRNEDDSPPPPILQLTVSGDGDTNPKTFRNRYISAVRAKYWNALFHAPEFIKQLTTKMQTELLGRIKQLEDYDFSEFNIYSIRHDLSEGIVKGVRESILELFDAFSYKHSYTEYSKNIHYFNGWKTNKGWKINHRIVQPLNGYCAWDGGFYPDEYTLVRRIEDIERIFNYLDGGLSRDINVMETLRQAKKDKQSRKIVLKYFEITFYQKGTAHITFTNLDLLKKFNFYGSQQKRWLPDGYGRKPYEEMTLEEKAVVESYEGRKSYEEMTERPEYYLALPGGSGQGLLGYTGEAK